MRVIRDLISGNVSPVPLDLPYNGDLATDSTTKRYKGSLVKFMDFDDIDHGFFATFAGLTTAMENVCGILEEEHPTSDNYLPDDTTYSVRYRKVTPILPSSIIEAEYSPKDAAGTDNTDTSMTGTSGSTTVTVTISTSDTLIGAWLYIVTGACAGFLSYITDNGTTTLTLANALPATLAAADTELVILRPNERLFDFDATYSGIKSEISDGSRTDLVMGISTWIKAPGIAMTKLDRETHSGLIITGAQFFHQFTIPTNATYPNAWISGIKAS